LNHLLDTNGGAAAPPHSASVRRWVPGIITIRLNREPVLDPGQTHRRML